MQAVLVQTRLVAGAIQHGHQAFRRVVARPQTERADSRVHAISPCLNGLHQRHQGYASGGVGVHMNAHAVATACLDALDDVIGGLGLEQRCHVLQADRVAAQFHQALCHFDKGLCRMQGAYGVADGALGMFAVATDRLHRMADVADVVERVKDTKNIHAIAGSLVHEAVNHAVFVVAVAQQVLTAQQHLETGIGQQGTELPQARPGVFIQEPDAGIKGGAAPAFHGPVASLINVGAGWHHVLHGQTGG